MAKIIVLAAMAAILQLAGALTEPECPVMEGERFTLVTELAICKIASITGWPEGGTALDCLRTFFPHLCLCGCSVCTYVNYN